ncbi:MAG: ROK family protein [Bacteroidales bacterium]|nr:ROK family protein [Bacteroidales bacterium]
MTSKEYFLGVDIGGTKCAVLAGTDNMEILDRVQFPTLTEKRPEQAILKILEHISELRKRYHDLNLLSIGISCGGPLNSKTGVIHSPPNLPGWDDIPIVDIIKEKTGVPTFIQNDANACALAEWKFGAGKGCENMVFLTFGTGMGAGLILNGRLYTGTNDNAGEVGHIRLADDGPVGYNKAGSFEGFCSGGGITRLAQIIAEEKLKTGKHPSYCRSLEELQDINTAQLAKLANEGDKDALELFEISAKKLGAGLSIIIDIINPERIVIGSVYARNKQLFDKISTAMIEREALEPAWKVCEIVPAELGEKVGDFASLSVAIDGFNRNK